MWQVLPVYALCCHIKAAHSISWKEAQISVWSWKVGPVIHVSYDITSTTCLYFFKAMPNSMSSLNGEQTQYQNSSSAVHQIIGHAKISAVAHSLSDSQGVKSASIKKL